LHQAQHAGLQIDAIGNPSDLCSRNIIKARKYRQSDF
jgi:hypothetical protein